MCRLRQFPEGLSLSKVKRRLSNSEFNTYSRDGRRVEEIWADAEIIFGKSRERYLFGIDTVWQIKETSAFDTGAGRGNV